MTLNAQNTEQDLFISEISILNWTVITIEINICIHHFSLSYIKTEVGAKTIDSAIKRPRVCCNDHFKIGFN